MKIKIIKGKHWYTDRVGEIFEVGLKDVYSWKVIKGFEKSFGIYKEHAEIVEGDNEKERGCMTCKNGTRHKGCMCWDQQCTHGLWEKWEPIEKESKQQINNCNNCGYVKPCNRCRNFDNYPHWIPNEQEIKIDELIKLSNEPVDDIQWISEEDIKKLIKTVKYTKSKVEEGHNLTGNNIINKELLLKSIKDKIKMLEIDFMYIDTEIAILREFESEIENNKYSGNN